jgi:hypothetical protein
MIGSRVTGVIQQFGRSRVGGDKPMNAQPDDFAEGAARLAQMDDMTIDKIRKLAELHKEGILTDEEFSEKKADLLKHL